VIHTKLGSILFGPNIDGIFVSSKSFITQSDGYFTAALESHLHTVPLSILDVCFTVPHIGVVVTHESDQFELVETSLLAFGRVGRNQTYEVSTICPEQQLHISSPIYEACHTKRESQREIEVWRAFFCWLVHAHWHVSEGAVRGLTLGHRRFHFDRPCVILKQVLAGTTSLRRALPSGTASDTTSTDEATRPSETAIAEIIVSFKLLEVRLPLACGDRTFLTAC